LELGESAISTLDRVDSTGEVGSAARIVGVCCTATPLLEDGRIGSTVLALETVSPTETSDIPSSVIEGTESVLSEVTEGTPDSLLTKNCDTEVFFGDGKFLERSEVGGALEATESIESEEGSERSEDAAVRLSDLNR